MKPEAQKIAIAEACGWTNVRVEGQGIGAFPLGNIPKVEGQAWTSTRHMVPNYLKDLNAMREAVETLRGMDGPQWFDFQRTLMIECGSWMNCIQATAVQRAEAFLRTLNLWKP